MCRRARGCGRSTGTRWGRCLHPPFPSGGRSAEVEQGMGSDVFARRYAVGGGGVPPPRPLRPPGPPPPPPPLPMFEADSQNFASAPSVPRGFTLQNVWPPFGGDYRAWEEGGSQPNPSFPPFPPSNTSLGMGCGGRVRRYGVALPCPPPPPPHCGGPKKARVLWPPQWP